MRCVQNELSKNTSFSTKPQRPHCGISVWQAKALVLKYRVAIADPTYDQNSTAQ